MSQDCLSRAALEQLRDDTAALQRASDRRLQSLVAAANPGEKMQTLARARAKLSAALDAAASLGTETQSATYTSVGVAERVKTALELYKRAEAARARVDATIQLKTAIVGMYAAMDQRDWERAAAAASSALNLSNDVVNSELSMRMVPTIEIPDPPQQSLKAACDDMGALFSREFDKAAASRQMDQVTRFFKLFPQIGQDHEGLKKYSRFICGIIAGQSRSLLLGSTDSSEAGSTPDTNPKFYGLAMARLFENIATILAQHAPLIERYYGPQAMPEVIAAIQNEVDVQSGLILDTWWDERRVDRVLAEAKGYSYPYLVAILTSTPMHAGETVEAADLNIASTCLGEMSMMVNRWSLYCDFIDQRWPPARPALQESRLVGKIVDLLTPAFGALSLFVFRRSVEKAVDMDELPGAVEHHVDTPLVSSMVDDVMYVLSTLLGQTVDTGNTTILERVLPTFRRVLESDYVGALQRKLRDASPSRVSPETSNGYLVYLNDLEVTKEYVEKITGKHEGLHDNETTEHLKSGFNARVDDLVSEACQTYFSVQVAAQVRSSCTAAFKGTYMLSPTEPDSSKSAVFEINWRKHVSPLVTQVHSAVYSQIISLAAESVARALEKYIWSLESKVNELGVIALDRDTSRIISVISEHDYKVRDKFVRVCQLVMVIGGEDIDTSLTPDEEERARRICV